MRSYGLRSAAVASGVVLGLILGYAWERGREASLDDARERAAHDGRPAQGGRESQPGSTDPTGGVQRLPGNGLLQELEQRESLSAEECLAALDAWFARPDALPRQLPMYDAVMRLEKGGFATVAHGLESREAALRREVQPIVMDRWLREDPQQVWSRQKSRLENGEPAEVGWSALAVALAREDGASALELAALVEREYPRISRHVYEALAGYWRENGAEDWLGRIKGKVEPDARDEEAAAPTVAESREKARQAEAAGRWGELERLLRQLGEHDLWSALELADQIEDDGQRTRIGAQLLPALAATNPVEALRRVLELDRASRMANQHLLKMTISVAVEQDQGTTLEWFLQQGDEATMALMDLLDGRQGSKELPLLMAMPDSSRRKQLLQDALNVYGKENYAEAEQWIRDNLDESALVEFRLNALPNRIADELEEAKAFAASLEHPQQRFRAASVIATHLAASDLEEALRWTMEDIDEETRDAVLVQLSYRWMQERPEELIRYASRLEDGRLKQNLQQRVVAHRKDTSTGRELLRFAAALDDRRLASQVASSAIHDLGLSDPQEAIQELDRWIAREPDRAWVAAAQFASQWSASDPKGAAAAFFPRGDEVARGALPTVMGSWISTSPETSLEAVGYLPSEELQREALQVVLEHHELRQRYPEVAAQAEAALKALGGE